MTIMILTNLNLGANKKSITGSGVPKKEESGEIPTPNVVSTPFFFIINIICTGIIKQAHFKIHALEGVISKFCYPEFCF